MIVKFFILAYLTEEEYSALFLFLNQLRSKHHLFFFGGLSMYDSLHSILFPFVGSIFDFKLPPCYENSDNTEDRITS